MEHRIKSQTLYAVIMVVHYRTLKRPDKKWRQCTYLFSFYIFRNRAKLDNSVSYNLNWKEEVCCLARSWNICLFFCRILTQINARILNNDFLSRHEASHLPCNTDVKQSLYVISNVWPCTSISYFPLRKKWELHKIDICYVVLNSLQEHIFNCIVFLYCIFKIVSLEPGIIWRFDTFCNHLSDYKCLKIKGWSLGFILWIFPCVIFRPL